MCVCVSACMHACMRARKQISLHRDNKVVLYVVIFFWLCFQLFKKFPEFEELRTKLHEAFSGMALPLVVKKSIIVNEAVIRDRRNCLDTFMKFISATPRVVTSSHVLSFLGAVYLFITF